jgi:hypothetical protein
MCANHIFEASPKKCENSPNKKEKKKLVGILYP